MITTFTYAPGVDVHGLLQLALAGDRAAMEQLLRLLWPKLVVFVKRRLNRSLRRRIDASDVVQEVMLPSVRCLSCFSGRSYDDFEYWIRFVCHRELLRLQRFHLRTHRRAVDREEQLTVAQIDRQLENKLAKSAATRTHTWVPAGEEPDQRQLWDRVQTAVLQLHPSDQDIVRWRFWDDCTSTALAERLQISPDSARKRLERALRRLRRVLAREGIKGTD